MIKYIKWATVALLSAYLSQVVYQVLGLSTASSAGKIATVTIGATGIIMTLFWLMLATADD